MKNFRYLLVSVLISVAGCQTGQPVKTAAIDNGSFMSLWSTYSHCHATTGIDQLREDALTLTNAATISTKLLLPKNKKCSIKTSLHASMTHSL